MGPSVCVVILKLKLSFRPENKNNLMINQQPYVYVKVIIKINTMRDDAHIKI